MQEQIETASDEISLKELIQKLGQWWAYLKTQWWKIAIAGLLGGIIGFVYAARQPITYSSKITFVVEDGKSGGGMGGLASLAGQFGVDVGGSGGGGVMSGDNILLYFKSESLAREVLLSRYDTASNESVADVYAEVYKLKEGWAKNEKIGKIDFPVLAGSRTNTRLQDSLLKGMIANIIATQMTVGKTDKKSGFIDVSTKMEEEVLAKKYCEKVVEIAVERYLNVKTKRQKAIVAKLQTRVDSIANLLSRKTASSAALQTSSATMDINPLYRTGTVVEVETTIRDKTMLTNIYASASQNLEMAKFTLSQETPVILVVDSSEFPLKKEKLSKVKAAIVLSFVFGLVSIIFFSFKKLINNTLNSVEIL